MLFEKIIKNQSDKESIRIYNEENEKPLRGEVLLIKIKNNKIVNTPRVSIPWKQRSIAWKVMIEDTLKNFSVSDCSIKINLDDKPKKGHFNFCRPTNNNKGVFLIPNFRFTNDNLMNNYQVKLDNNCEGVKWEDTKSYIFENDTLPFEDKKKMFFFAGNDAGDKRKKYFDYMPNNLNICDGYLWGNTNSKLVSLNKCGKKYLPYSKHFEYKYPILIDPQDAGTDRMRLLLSMNSVPIVCTEQFEEFYSYLLSDNENYISCTNIEQLKDIINNRNIISDKRIIQNNKEFVKNILTYKNILEYIANLLNALNNHSQ